MGDWWNYLKLRNIEKIKINDFERRKYMLVTTILLALFYVKHATLWCNCHPYYITSVNSKYVKPKAIHSWDSLKDHCNKRKRMNLKNNIKPVLPLDHCDNLRAAVRPTGIRNTYAPKPT